MNEEKLNQIIKAIEGLNAHEWTRISQAISMAYSSKSTKLQLDGQDSLLIKNHIALEFGLTPQQSE